MMQLAERQKRKTWTVRLSFCLSDYLCRLTFHTEFGAAAVFVDENKKDEEEDASEARQAHSNGNLREMKCCVRLRRQCSHHNPFQISDHLKYRKSEQSGKKLNTCLCCDVFQLTECSLKMNRPTQDSQCHLGGGKEAATLKLQAWLIILITKKHLDYFWLNW